MKPEVRRGLAEVHCDKIAESLVPENTGITVRQNTSFVYALSESQHRNQRHNDNDDKIANMRIVEVIIDGFKSYAVRTVISGWDDSFNSVSCMLYTFKTVLMCVRSLASMAQARVTFSTPLSFAWVSLR
jgi:hypothetical protein